MTIKSWQILRQILTQYQTIDYRGLSQYLRLVKLSDNYFLRLTLQIRLDLKITTHKNQKNKLKYWLKELQKDSSQLVPHRLDQANTTP